MLFRSEKRGIMILSALILSFFILHEATGEKECSLFLLPAPSMIDTTILATRPPRAIELNSADSATLVKIRGIGPYYAMKIIRYREQLGGFYSTKQLKEIKFQYLSIDSLLPRFTVNPTLIRKRELDSLDFKTVLRHPYLEYEDVVLIFNTKRKHGKINYTLLESERILPLFKLKKIKPYFN